MYPTVQSSGKRTFSAVVTKRPPLKIKRHKKYVQGLRKENINVTV